MDANGRIRVACIGGGAWGKNLIRNFHQLDALETICETEASRRRELALAYPDVPVTKSLDDVLSDRSVDAVAIATPAETHCELTRRSLLAGKHVFVEKPLCLSTAEGRQVLDLARERERILMVGHLLWYHPAVLKLKELVDAGELGRLQYIYSNRLNLGRIRREENILWSFAPHDISVILGLLEEMPESVEAWGGNFLHDRISDVTVSVLSFPSGVRAHVFVSWLHPFKEQKLIVVGDRKMAVFDDTEAEHKLRLYPYSLEWRNRMPIPRKGDSEPVEVSSEEPLRAECAHFLECVRRKEPPRTDGAEGLRVLSVLEACQRQLEASSAGDRRAAPRPPPAQPLASRDESTTERASHRRDGESSEPFFVHESAYVEDGVEIGRGTKVWHFSHLRAGTRLGADCSVGQNVVIGPDVKVGDGVKIQNNVSVYEGVTLEDYVFCGPSMVFTNVLNPRSEIPRMDELRRTTVKHGATLGANCTILCGTTIGGFAFVGAGAVVLDDVPDHALVVGNPGRLIGWMCRCGHRVDFDDSVHGACRACGAAYLKDGERVRPA